MSIPIWRASARLHPDEVSLTLPHITLAGCYWRGKSGPELSVAALGQECAQTNMKGEVLLIALHGWLDNAHSFYPLAQYLDDYPILAIDWPGHGLSQHRSLGYPLHFFDYLYDLAKVIEHCRHQFTHIVVMGHSLGAMIASTYGAAQTDTLDAAILLEGLLPMAESSQHAKARLQQSLSAHQSVTKPIGYQSIESMAAARSKLTGLSSKWSHLLVTRNAVECAGKFYWRTDPRLKRDSPWRMTIEQREQILANTELPMLLVQAEQGYHQLNAQLAEAKRWFPLLESSCLPGCHHFHMSAAELVAQKISDFIRQHFESPH